MDVVNALIGLAAANIFGLYSISRHRTISYSHKRKCFSENDFTAIKEKIVSRLNCSRPTDWTPIHLLLTRNSIENVKNDLKSFLKNAYYYNN